MLKSRRIGQECRRHITTFLKLRLFRNVLCCRKRKWKQEVPPNRSWLIYSCPPRALLWAKDLHSLMRRSTKTLYGIQNILSKMAPLLTTISRIKNLDYKISIPQMKLSTLDQDSRMFVNQPSIWKKTLIIFSQIRRR